MICNRYFFFARCWNEVLDTSCGVFLICLKSMLRDAVTIILCNSVYYAVPSYPWMQVMLSSGGLSKLHLHSPSCPQCIPLHLLCLKSNNIEMCSVAPARFCIGVYSRQLQRVSGQYLSSLGKSDCWVARVNMELRVGLQELGKGTESLIT